LHALVRPPAALAPKKRVANHNKGADSGASGAEWHKYSNGQKRADHGRNMERPHGNAAVATTTFMGLETRHRLGRLPQYFH
jgi:hypothetical protein